MPATVNAKIDAALIRRLRRQALRLGRCPDDAEDLVQATLLAALEAGRSDPPWLAGVLVRQHALAARGAIRRRRREASAADWSGAVDTAAAPESRTVLRPLPPAARRVAVLALHGLDGAEIRFLLGLSPAAFRQRLSTIRRCLRQLPPAQQPRPARRPGAPRARTRAGVRRRRCVGRRARDPRRGRAPAAVASRRSRSGARRQLSSAGLSPSTRKELPC